MKREKISKNFNRSEFACRCGCGMDTVDVKTLEMAQAVRDHFGYPVFITGPNRCAYHNAAVGGALDSQHVKARAIDFRVVVSMDEASDDYLKEAVSPLLVADFLNVKYPNSGGFGVYDNPGRVHADSRADKARWDNRINYA